VQIGVIAKLFDVFFEVQIQRPEKSVMLK